MKRSLTGFGCCLVLIFAAGCGEKKEPTEAEKGKELVEKKLEFAEGASEALNDKGAPVGRSAGKGVGGLLKGLGTGLVDAIYPPVEISPSEELVGAGIKVNKSEEGHSTGKGNEVNLTLAFSKIYKGKMTLHAFDEKNVEMGRTTSKLLNQPADSILDLTLYLDKNIRMSAVDHCELRLVPPKAVTLVVDGVEPGAEADGTLGIELGQMQEGAGNPLEVSQYVIFNGDFAGELQLRAFDATDAEVGRSQKVEDLEQGADSSETFEFTFHETLDGDSVARFELHAKKAEAKSGKGKKKGKKK